MGILSRSPDMVARDFGLGGNGAHVVIPSIVGPLLATILVLNRLYWRIHLVRTLGIDDLCIALSLIFLFALAIVNLVAVSHGYGQSAQSLEPADLQLALQMFYLDQIFYKFTINLTKLSILTLYLRIFTQTWFVRTCWACFALVSAYAVASILVTVFQCTPINYYWDHHAPHTANPRSSAADTRAASTETGPHCISTTAFWLANAIYNISSDIVILVSLPFMIWSLRLARSQKIGLTFVFGLGIFVFATSILRLTTLRSGSKARDPLVGTVISTMWTMIESSTAVVCACLPMCRTPLQRVWPRLFPSKYGSASGAQTQSQSNPRGRQNSGSRGLGSDHARTTTSRNNPSKSRRVVSASSAPTSGSRLGLGTGSRTGPREVSGGMLAGHRGPGGRTMEDEDGYGCDDLEMLATSRCRSRDGSVSGSGSASGSGCGADPKSIVGEVVPVKVKEWR